MSDQRNDYRNDSHLPECPMLDKRYPKHPLENCDYCNMLRACEQRMTEDLPAVLFGHGDEKTVLQIRDMGYAAGVAAARNVVLAYVHPECLDEDNPQCDVCPELIDRADAIDALRGES